jgi:hypothetical protein
MRRTIDRQGDSFDLSVEGEGRLVVLIVDAGQRVRADVERLVPLQNQWQGALHLLLSYDLAVQIENSHAAAADAGEIVEGESSDPQAIVFEVELQRVLAGRERFGAFPAHPLQIDQVPGKNRLALEEIEAIAGEAAALCVVLRKRFGAHWLASPPTKP